MSDRKIVLLTGAGSGPGRAITVASSAAGHHVVAAGRTAATLAETVSAARVRGRPRP